LSESLSLEEKERILREVEEWFGLPSEDRMTVRLPEQDFHTSLDILELGLLHRQCCRRQTFINKFSKKPRIQTIYTEV